MPPHELLCLCNTAVRMTLQDIPQYDRGGGGLPYIDPIGIRYAYNILTTGTPG